MKSARVALTLDEYEHLMGRARAAGLSTGSYLRTCALGKSGPRAKRTPPVDRALLGEVLAQLKRTGNNINQIAHHLNAGGHPDRAAMNDTRAALNDCVLQILKAIGRVDDH